MQAADARLVLPARRLAGTLRVPGDKSISHRALLLGALAHGETRVSNLGPGDDCRATLECLQRLGVVTSDEAAPAAGRGLAVRVHGRGPAGLRPVASGLDAHNSGTTARLLMGVLSGLAFPTLMTGDESLRRRPMRRVVDPLTRMGARIETTDGRLPVRIAGTPLQGIDYTMPVASAQVKSAILIAGLNADGVTTVREPAPTRNHTELAFRAFGGRVDVQDGLIRVPGGQRLEATEIAVPGDPSSAAFWAAAAAALPGSAIDITEVGLNPTRLGFLDVLRRAGARIQVEPAPPNGP